MPLTERERHDAYEALRTTFGDHTDAVIDLLRPDEQRLATKDDLAVLRAEMAELRGELRGEMAELRGELRTEMAELRTEMAEMGLAIRQELHQAIAAQTRTLMIALVTAIVLMSISVTVGPIAG
jgi:hypothetical protein